MRLTPLILILLAVFAGTVYADRTAKDATESVRYVDLQRCLAEWTTFKAQSEGITTGFGADRERLNTAYEELQGAKGSLSLMDNTTNEFREASFQIKLMEETLRARTEWTTGKLQAEQTGLFESSMRRIHQVVAEIGQREGFSAIMMHPNEIPPLGPNVSRNDVLNELDGRWVMWSNPTFDITDQVLFLLNQN